MTDERRRVLDLLAQGKITVDEADQLLRALGAPKEPSGSTRSGNAAGKPRYIRITVHKKSNGSDGAKDVNIRVPLPMLKGGMRLGAILPGVLGDRIGARLRERGFDCDCSKMDPETIDAVFSRSEEHTSELQS